MLVLALGAYDLISRRRVHPAWALGASYLVLSQCAANVLLHNDAWRALMQHLVVG